MERFEVVTRPAIEALVRYRDDALRVVTFCLGPYVRLPESPEQWRFNALRTSARIAYSCAEVIEALTDGEL